MDADLAEALQRTAACVKEKFLSASFHQCAWPEAIHHRRWITCTQESYFDSLRLRGDREKGTDKYCSSNHSAANGGGHDDQSCLVSNPTLESHP
jgi:hypothetical protein